MWTNVPGTPLIKLYNNIQTLQVDLVALRERAGFVEIRRGNGPGHSFEECLHTTAVAMYRSEVY
jgi:hypothetical protein